MVTIGVVVAAAVVLVIATRQWNEFTSNDLGFMSAKWLAEYNSQNP